MTNTEAGGSRHLLRTGALATPAAYANSRPTLSLSLEDP